MKVTELTHTHSLLKQLLAQCYDFNCTRKEECGLINFLLFLKETHIFVENINPWSLLVRLTLHYLLSNDKKF